MKVRYIVASVALAISSLANADLPSLEQTAKATAGGVAGGLVGSQIGRGQGKTATTAAGAAVGTVAASGCKPTWLSAVGALVGGLVGSQVGQGDGKTTMAGVGAGIGALAGSDCDEPQNKPTAQNYSPNIGRQIHINGLSLTEADPGLFPAGKFAGWPRIQQKTDFVALDGLSREFAMASWEAAANEDWEAFLINRHLGMRVIEFRLHHKIAALDFVSSLATSNNGRGELAPGASVFVPAFSRWGNDQKYTASDYQKAILTANFDSVDWAELPKTADVFGVLNVLKNTANSFTNPGAIQKPAAGGIGVIAERQKVADTLQKLPIGAVFSAHDEAGNQFLVERTTDGYNIGNNGTRPVSVPLTKLGFMPDMPAPSDNQIKVSELLQRMQHVRKELFWQVTDYSNATSSMQAPNHIAIKNTPMRAELDKDGNMASDLISAQSGIDAYKTNAAWRTAFETVDPEKHRDKQFESGCFSLPNGKIYSTTFLGETSEILRHECFDKTKISLRSREYFLRDGKKLQTAESLLKDKSVADNLKNADSARDLAEGIVGFVPLIGNADAAAKCTTGTSITASLASMMNKTNRNEQYRAFVTDLLPPAQDTSVFERGMTCASAVPLAGSVLKGASKVGAAMGVFRDWSITDKGQSVIKGLEFFDTRIVGQGAAQFENIGGLAGNSIQTLKNFYDKLQTFNNSTQIYSAVGS